MHTVSFYNCINRDYGSKRDMGYIPEAVLIALEGRSLESTIEMLRVCPISACAALC